MRFFTPLRKAYSPLSLPSLSPSDNNHDGDPKFISSIQSSNSTLRTSSRHSFLIRVLIFILLEFSFLALVYATLWRPVILDLSFTITKVKGTITAIAILWHALAIFLVKNMLLQIFSAEWIAQYDGSQRLTLQELDSVSRLTTGFIDQAKHFITTRATHSFRLGFISFLLLILLNGLGPSAIGIGPGARFDYPSTIQVANLTVGFLQHFQSVVERATAVVQLEVVQNSTTSGFITRQSNLLIPWPSSDPLSENMTMRYQSDIIRYNFSCSWHIPSVTGLKTWMVADKEWKAYFTIDRLLPSWPGLENPLIFPLVRLSDVSTYEATATLTSFLFIGRNATPPSYINLEDVPSSVLPCNTTQNPLTYMDDKSVRCHPWLASVLMCDPQPEILPATINVTTSYLEATILPGAPAVKNILTEAANILFSTSLLDATAQSPYHTDTARPSLLAHKLFLPNLPFDFVHGERPLKPLSLDEINRNMNNVLASSAKPYLRGYAPDHDNIIVPAFATVNTSGVMEVRKMALVGSKHFLVASSVTVGLLVVLLSALVAITQPDQLEGFDLENIVRRLQ